MRAAVSLCALGLFTLSLACNEPNEGSPSIPQAPELPDDDTEAPSPPCIGLALEEGGCQPEAPRGTPPEACPSGEFNPHGVCHPSIPDLPDWPCPPGWDREVLLSDEEGVSPVSVCALPPLPELCPPGAQALPGASTCAQVMVAQYEGVWPEEAAIRDKAPGFDGRILYLQTGAAPEGTGTRDRPLASLGEALALAQRGDVLALAEGVFEGEVILDRGLALVGVSTETRLTASVRVRGEGSSLESLRLVGAGIVFEGSGEHRLSGVSIESAPRKAVEVGEGVKLSLSQVAVSNTRGTGIEIRAGGEVSAERVSVDGGQGAGVVVSGELSVDSLLVRGVRGGAGLRVRSGGRARIARAAFVDNDGEGVLVSGASSFVALEDAVVRASEGKGLSIAGEAGAQVVRGVFEDNVGVGVHVVEASLTLTGALIRQTRPSGQTEGLGLGLEEGASAVVAQIVVAENLGVGIDAQGEGADLSLEDAVVIGTLPEVPMGDFGIGVRILFDAEVVVARAALIRNRRVAMVVGARAKVEVTDARIRDTAPQASDLTNGAGVIAALGGEASLTRVSLSRQHSGHLLAFGRGSLITGVDLIMEEGLPQASDGLAGVALDAWSGARVELERCSISRMHRIAVAVLEPGTHLQLRDTTIEDTQPTGSNQSSGSGLLVLGGASLDAGRLRFENNFSSALSVLFDSTARIEDLLIEGTKENFCDADPCIGEVIGHGIILGESEVSLTRFLVNDNSLVGLQILEGTDLTARDGLLTRNRIGLNIQDTGFDPTTHFENVRAYGNDIDYDLSELPTISAEGLLDGLLGD